VIAEDRRKFWLVFFLLLTMVLSAALLSLPRRAVIALPRASFDFDFPRHHGGAAAADSHRLEACGTGGTPACPLNINLTGRCGGLVSSAPRGVQVDICGSD
jgi:hypothetical protein